MEVSAKQPSLTELCIFISPWTHIKEIRLLRSTIESDPVEELQTFRINHSFDAKTDLNREQQTLTVQVYLAVWVDKLVKITAEFILKYSVDKSPIEVTNEVAAAFGKMTGVYNTWPYWREYVQCTSSRLGLPPMTLPLITSASLEAYYAQKAKEKGSESQEIISTERATTATPYSDQN